MTEPVKIDGVEPIVEQTQEPVEKILSDVEQKAMDMGWRPREEFAGEDEDFVDAKEFVGRKPLFDKIESVSREAKATRKALEALQTHYTKVKETEFNRALKELKATRSQALVDGDVDRFNAIEEELEQIAEDKEKFSKEQQRIQPEDQQVHPEFAQWIARNPWYESQPHMHAFAEQVGARFQGSVRAGTMTPQQVLKEIEKAVREEFPNRFRNANKDKPGAVEGASRKGGASSSSVSDAGLTDQERTIMNTLVRGGHITKEKYLADLRQIKEQK
jgi:hypothetical protein